MSHQLNPWALINLGSGKGGSIVPGSGFRPGNILQNLKSTDWGGFSRNDKGSITGMHGVAGAAVFAGGTMLAERGLMGSGAGTWGGVAEGTAGGAAIGFTMGGPLGAAIGAGVGLGIGLGEKAFGVKSLQQTAHDDIKSVYGVDIPTNSGTVKQVVETCEVAVRRKRLGGRAVAQREATRDAVLGGDRPEDALVGDDALRREPGGAGRQSLPAGQLPEQRLAHVRIEPADAGRHPRQRRIPRLAAPTRRRAVA